MKKISQRLEDGGNEAKSYYAGLDVAKFVFSVLIITLHLPLNEFGGVLTK